MPEPGEATERTRPAPAEPARVRVPEPAPSEPLQAEKSKAAQVLDKVLNKLTDLGVPILKYGGWGVSFVAELLGPATLWLPKVSLVAAGFGLDKLGGRHPDSRISRLAKALGSGVWRGGALGGVASLAINTILPKEIISDEAVLPTDALSQKAQELLNGIAKGGISIPTEITNLPANIRTAAESVTGSIDLSGPAGAIKKAGEEIVRTGEPQLEEMVGGLYDFLKTPVGKMVGFLGVGGAVYGIMNKLGLVRPPKGK